MFRRRFAFPPVRRLAKTPGCLRAVAVEIAALCCFLQPPTPAQASPIFVGNASFEMPLTNGIGRADTWVNFNDPDNNYYNPFRFSSANEAYIGANATTDPANSGAGYPGIDGRNLGFVFQNGDFTEVIGQLGDVGFQQTLDAVLEPHRRYFLTVAVGRRNGTVFAAPTLGSRLELLAGATVIAHSEDTVGPLPGQFRDQSSVLSDSNAFPALIGQPLTIRITTILPTTILNQATDWDNVRLDATIPFSPEPASLTLLSPALGVALLRRKKGIFTNSLFNKFLLKFRV